MSSLEIAELTGKEHKHIRRDIEEMLTKLSLNESNFGRIYIDSRNRQQEVYELPKRESLILVSGYSVELRAKIIDRWDELERKESAPKSFEQQTLEVIQGLVSRVEAMAPKAEFFDAVADAKGDRTIMDAAKLLKMSKPKSLYAKLREDGVIMGDNVAYQKYIDQDYFKIVLTEKNGYARSTTYVTNKGLAWLQRKYSSSGLMKSV
jgi:phage antirepressor YoqD-like protein